MGSAYRAVNFYSVVANWNLLQKSHTVSDQLQPAQEQKIELMHQDIGQMDMYVRMYEDLFRTDSDNPTMGIILCSEKDETIVKYSVLKENRKLFASKYKLYLPTEKELAAEIQREIEIFKRKDNGE